MRHPLNWYQSALRETACFLAGHDWRSSWRRVRDEEPPGWTRGKCGNPYFEYVASWHGKCRRCRARTCDDPYQPLWREVWWMLRSGWGALRIGVTCYWPWRERKQGRGYSVMPWWAYAVSLLAAPLFAFEQMWLCWFSYQWHFPSFPGAWAADLNHVISMWAESKATHYRWIPPQDPDDKNEIGFWLPEGDAQRTEETGEWRMRVWVYPGPGVTTA